MFTITTEVSDLKEGLFGQVLLWIFEILPELERSNCHPHWAIRSEIYGSGPQKLVIPGAFDLVSEINSGSGHFPSISLLDLRSRSLSALGNDWEVLSALWKRYFRVPDRVLARADDAGIRPGTLGVHYRGTDKNLASQDTNPVSAADMLSCIREALHHRPALQDIFVASDEPGFADLVRLEFPDRQVINLGAVSFHKSGQADSDRADRAVLDCLLLSRCEVVLKCSSALSGFAKILNPHLDIYRVAACKLFYDIPYFPDAYIPRWMQLLPENQSRHDRLFAGDWLEDPRVPVRFKRSFAYQPRYRGAERMLRRLKFLLTRQRLMNA